MGHTLKHNIEETDRIINSIMTILSENFLGKAGITI